MFTKKRLGNLVGMSVCALFLFSACNNMSAGKTSFDSFEPDAASRSVIENYASIGEKHNEALSSYYGDGQLDIENSDLYSKELLKKFDKVNGINAESVLEAVSFGDAKGGRAASESMVDHLLESELIGKACASYMQQVEDLLMDSTMDVTLAKNAITAIECDAIADLSDNDLDVFMNYAETAKASASYWNNQGRSISSWATGLRIAAADAAGAAAGTAFGIMTCNLIPDPTQALKIAYISSCAVATSAASSAMTYDKGEFTMFNPIKKVLEEAKDSLFSK